MTPPREGTTRPAAPLPDPSAAADAPGAARAGLARRLAVAHARGAVSLALWPLGRRHGVGPGDAAFGYSRGQSGMTLALLGAVIAESAALAYLVPWAWLDAVLLVLHVYTAAVFLAGIAAGITRPHVLTARELRVRHGTALDLRVPLRLVTGVRTARRFVNGGAVEIADGVLTVSAGSRTSLTVDLAGPLPVPGRDAAVTRIHLHADDPAALAAAVTAALRDAPDPSAPGPSARP
ncbi:hypothetical protein [Bailinhaonella thermotolerans]|uniref:Uncharacterized protein n=1 Tax=Bailinhaonella thermotolerans TaxID=1070861 RepID=A0A3A4AMC9_9ACTN|nr:hypothetical protein [Bailinhaonella thermotolerans]RJL30111.1 hypothetical protein D5H75_24635 [Bailinhaonella thermotolerans]